MVVDGIDYVDCMNNNDNIKKYFNQDEIIEVSFGSKKMLTRLRKYGDQIGQYVTSLRYLDLINKNTYDEVNVYAKVRVYANDLDDLTMLWSGYHQNDNCQHCQEYERNLKTNPLMGAIIYHRGAHPPKRDWTIFERKR